MKNKILVEKVIINGIHFKNINVTLETIVSDPIEVTREGTLGVPGDTYRKFVPGCHSSTLHIDLNDNEIVKLDDIRKKLPRTF